MAFQIPDKVVNSKAEECDWIEGTLHQLQDYITCYCKDGRLTPNSKVYTFESHLNLAIQYAGGTVGDLLNDLDRYIAQGHGDDRWVFDRDDGWHDHVVGLILYRRKLLIQVEPGWQD